MRDVQAELGTPVPSSERTTMISSKHNGKLIDHAKSFHDRIVAWRRHLHANPELTGQEEQTARWVAGHLREMGYEPVERVGGVHGVTTMLEAGSGPAVALRADMDALPITEETGLEYASKHPGRMHACGHDAHTAMLLGAALLLKDRKAELRSPVKFIFQPAEEEYPGGAAPMIAGGVLENVKAIFGIHICSDLAAGKVGTRQAAFMSSVNRLRIRIIGRGGHAASPAQCVDPVVVAANVILGLQTVVSRSIEMTESAVVSITQLIAGTADNVIPGEVRMIGTIRTLDEKVRARVCERVKRVAEGIAAAHGAEAKVEAEAGYPVLMNDKDVTQRALRAAVHIGFSTERVEVLEPRGGAEDFAYYCEKVPGAFVYLGARNPAKGCDYPHHHPKFNVDEDVLHLGAALHAQFCLEV